LKNKEKIFIRDSDIAFDLKHRAILNFNISKYDEAVEKGTRRYLNSGERIPHRLCHWECEQDTKKVLDGIGFHVGSAARSFNFQEFRSYASEVKSDAIAHLDEYLTEFENKITSRGATVLWAPDSHEALVYIRHILEDNHTQRVVKSKSMITEEIGFNEHAEKWKVEALETDLGEFIVQTAGEKPYHILTPAMHKSKQDVAKLFHTKFGTRQDASPAEIAAFVRTHLRTKFADAEVGITGANFIVADIGGIGLTENEGNGMMTVSFPKVHIVLAGIERVIPSVRQLPFFLQWLAVHGTGQSISAYNSLLLGPKNSEEKDGPEKMFVILLDNRRSHLLAQTEESQALKCIRCGACLNACPVYTNIGGYTYSSTYTGPIGSVITPFYNGFREFGHLSFACSLCGRCTENCPVKIPLHELLLVNRKSKVENYGNSFYWKNVMNGYANTFIKRKNVDFIQGKRKNEILSLLPSPLGRKKKMPLFAPHSFSKQWKKLKH
jgi:L-lactate dehydrogenase complex protein LldF